MAHMIAERGRKRGKIGRRAWLLRNRGEGGDRLEEGGRPDEWGPGGSN
jgi:hypothetical protein